MPEAFVQALKPMLGKAGGIEAPPPLSLYIHIPWCVQKCPYCDFNSHGLRGEPLSESSESAYIDALVRDLEQALPQVWGRPVETVFLGGGTPSLLSAGGLERILTTVRTLLPLRPWAEITLEANPGTFEVARFRDYRRAGVNRLSLGVQSFNSRHLNALGRIHDAQEAWHAVESAQAIFENVNLDLMYALPEQTLAESAQDIDIAIRLGTSHLSAYHLTLEPNTAFAAAPPSLPDDELSADMQLQVEGRLAEAGFAHYETSAFARGEKFCKHNLNYWQFGDYLGIGAGAHSKLTFHDGIRREARWKHPRDYMDKVATGEPVAEWRSLEKHDLGFEFMMNALRLTGGFAPGLFAERTGLAIAEVGAALRRAESLGLVEARIDQIRPTERGRHYLNDLLELFLP